MPLFDIVIVVGARARRTPACIEFGACHRGGEVTRLDPSSPRMTLLLVMLHTGTMFAVIVYFWQQWRRTYSENIAAFKKFVTSAVLATALTGVIGQAIIKIIEGTAFKASPGAEIEDLFSHLELIAPALAIAGILIVIAGIAERRSLGALRNPGS